MYITGDSGSQPNTTAAFTGRKDGPRCSRGDSLEQLRLGHPGVTHQEDVQVTANLNSARGGKIGTTTDQLAEQCLLDVLHASDLRTYTSGQFLDHRLVIWEGTHGGYLVT